MNMKVNFYAPDILKATHLHVTGGRRQSVPPEVPPSALPNRTVWHDYAMTLHYRAFPA